MRPILVLICLMILSTACNKNEVTKLEHYKPTPTFSTENNKMIGIEGKVGILDTKFNSNETFKVLWHLWGEPSIITGAFRLEGTHIESNEKTPILLVDMSAEKKTWEYNKEFTQGNLGAVKTMPSYVRFDKSGLWKINVYLGKSPFAEFIIDVE
ncbi:DUF4871 domain-containing protein [Bacillus sp. DJP31]|uniref:DUF4871 domain-containing protein n=1 Tax=Bacillus sp. DJP31 TaxID=3409789 RepID=UPI003BB757CE